MHRELRPDEVCWRGYSIGRHPLLSPARALRARARLQWRRVPPVLLIKDGLQLNLCSSACSYQLPSPWR